MHSMAPLEVQMLERLFRVVMESEDLVGMLEQTLGIQEVGGLPAKPLMAHRIGSQCGFHGPKV